MTRAKASSSCSTATGCCVRLTGSLLTVVSVFKKSMKLLCSSNELELSSTFNLSSGEAVRGVAPFRISRKVAAVVRFQWASTGEPFPLRHSPQQLQRSSPSAKTLSTFPARITYVSGRELAADAVLLTRRLIERAFGLQVQRMDFRMLSWTVSR